MRSSSLGTLALAMCMAVAPLASAGDGRVDLARAMSVSLRLADEPRPLAGELTAWDRSRIWFRVGGEEVEREIAWEAIQPALGFDVARRLIDTGSAADWVWLGLLMLKAPNEGLAKRAFDVAIRLQPELKEKVASAMVLRRGGQDPAAAFAAAPPEATPAPAEGESKEPQGAPGEDKPPRRGVTLDRAGGRVLLWPALTEQQQAEHTATMRRLCEGFLAKASLKIEPVETRRFLLYSELSRPETQRWAGELDKMYSTLITTLEIAAGAELFQGKCAVFVFREKQSFIDFERAAFATDATRFAGVNHQRSGYTFTAFYKGANEQLFNSTLIHETVHAFMYRYRSPIALPTWANEGLADFVAGHLVTYSTEPLDHWNHARNFIAMKKSALEIMRLSYTDGSWPTDDSYPVSHMLVRFMLKNKPREFKLWIDDIKEGKDWRESMIQRFGVTPEVLAQGFGVDILREPGYSRLR